MAVAEHLTIGRHGEEAAARYLLELGYDIRERNVRFRRDEIDIVAYDRRRGMMVFVEVKARSSVSALYPIRTAVDRRKKKCLRRAIGRWIVAKRYDGPGRIDIVTMSGDKVVEHVLDVGSDFF